MKEYREPEHFKRDTRDARRFIEWPQPLMVLIGSRFRHARHQLGVSQRKLAERAEISQSVISRFERGYVTGMTVERLMRWVVALGPQFPFGCCPHDHKCKWPSDPSK